jgi:hypothetical protein
MRFMLVSVQDYNRDRGAFQLCDLVRQAVLSCCGFAGLRPICAFDRDLRRRDGPGQSLNVIGLYRGTIVKRITSNRQTVTTAIVAILNTAIIIVLTINPPLAVHVSGH